jgi:hypothetical protein
VKVYLTIVTVDGEPVMAFDVSACEEVLRRAMKMRREKLGAAEDIFQKRKEVADLKAKAVQAGLDADQAYSDWHWATKEKPQIAAQLSYDWERADAAQRWAWDAYYVATDDLRKMEARDES